MDATNLSMNRSFNRLCVIAIMVILVSLAANYWGEFHSDLRWTWGDKEPDKMGTHELFFSGRQAGYNWDDPWPTQTSTCWEGEELRDFYVSVFVAECFRYRTTWYLGNTYARGRKDLPHFFHFSRSSRVDFVHIAMVATFPLFLWPIVNRRLLRQPVGAVIRWNWRRGAD